jgi:hypothetical protein
VAFLTAALVSLAAFPGNGRAASPANDHFANRAALSGVAPSILTYSTGATLEAGEPQHAGATCSGSLWWTWIAPISGEASFSTHGSGRPLVIAVYSGDSLQALSALGSNSASFGHDSEASSESLSIPVVAGAAYQIAIATPAGSVDSPGAAHDLVIFGINQAPTILSEALVRAAVGSSISFPIEATNNPGSFTASGLPPGLILDPVSGKISGSPEVAGSFDVSVSATNPGGTAQAAIRFEIGSDAPAAPEWTSGAATVTGYVGADLTYALHASHDPAAFSASNLPPGLAVMTRGASGDASRYGWIAGIPTAAGVFKVPVKASNAAGETSGVVTFLIHEKPPPPVLESAAVTYATVGQDFSYKYYVSARSSAPSDAFPIAITFGDLPPGLGYSSYYKTILGTPSTAGIFRVPVTASNAGGATTGTLTIVVAEPEAAPPWPRPRR